MRCSAFPALPQTLFQIHTLGYTLGAALRSATNVSPQTTQYITHITQCISSWTFFVTTTGRDMYTGQFATIDLTDRSPEQLRAICSDVVTKAGCGGEWVFCNKILVSFCARQGNLCPPPFRAQHHHRYPVGINKSAQMYFRSAFPIAHAGQHRGLCFKKRSNISNTWCWNLCSSRHRFTLKHANRANLKEACAQKVFRRQRSVTSLV